MLSEYEIQKKIKELHLSFLIMEIYYTKKEYNEMVRRYERKIKKLESQIDKLDAKVKTLKEDYNVLLETAAEA